MIGASRVDTFIVSHSQFFPAHVMPELRERLMMLDEGRWLAISSMPYKEPMTALILGIFLGELGVDRFYIGDVGIGVLKLLTCGGCFLWWFIDLFLIQNATREANAKRLMGMMY